MADVREVIALLERLDDAERHSQQRVLGSHIFGEAATALRELLAEVDRKTEALRTADVLFHHAFSLPGEEQHLWLFSEEGCDAWQVVRAALHGFNHDLSDDGRTALEQNNDG